MANYILWDPPEEKYQDTPEGKVRPRREGLLQLEMHDLESYALYAYPSTLKEYDSIDQFRMEILRQIRGYIKAEEPGIRDPDLDYESNTLADRGLSMMASYRIANIDLNDRTVHMVQIRRARNSIGR